MKLKNLLQKSDPFSRKGCERDECIICKKDLGIDCRVRGCVYEMVCAECEDKKGIEHRYRGQTGRSTHHRSNEHFDNWEKKKEDSPLWRHSIEYHNMNTFPVKMKILDRSFGRPTRRMITEVVRIAEMEETESLNNKKEYGCVRVPKVNVEV